MNCHMTLPHKESIQTTKHLKFSNMPKFNLTVELAVTDIIYLITNVDPLPCFLLNAAVGSNVDILTRSTQILRQQATFLQTAVDKMLYYDIYWGVFELIYCQRGSQKIFICCTEWFDKRLYFNNICKSIPRSHSQKRLCYCHFRLKYTVF